MLRAGPAVLSITLLLTLVPAMARADNPVTNGGFEKVAPSGVVSDWSTLGRVEVTREAHSGERALRFVRGTEELGETGLNRAWVPDSGEQGAMLDVLKGGIRFHYKAVSSEGCRMVIYVIPMSKRPFEDTGDRRAAFEVPEEQVGDGGWHEGALTYDFTANSRVKWLHVSVRLIGGRGEMLFDDVSYVERVGPQLAIRRLALRDDSGETSRAHLVFAIANTGDEPTPAPRVEIAAPPALQVSAPRLAGRPLAPATEVDVACLVTGPRRAGTALRITASAGQVLTSRTLRLDPRIDLAWVLAHPFLIAPGETTELTAKITNRGSAIAERVVCSLGAQAGIELADGPQAVVCSVDPGRSGTVSWKLRATHTGNVKVPVVVVAGSTERAAAVQLSCVTPAARELTHIAGPLWLGTVRGGGAPQTDPPGGSIERRWSMGELRARSDGQWVTVARLPWLARVAVRGVDGEVEYLSPLFEPARGRPRAVALRGMLTDERGGRWTFDLVASEPVLDGKAMRVHWSVQCDTPRELLAFEGPMVYAGEGTVGSAKTEALFPGLEWLVQDEISSSTLDIHAGHPDQVRTVPPPNMVTIPYMSVTTPDATVGLLWNVHQKWDGSSDRPQPVFAVPARFEGRASSLMGLMAPNTMTGLERNRRLAETPYAMRPGTALRISAHIYVDADAAVALAAQDAWFDLYRPDPVLPPPQGDYTKQIDFSMVAYLESLYDEEEKAWWPFQGGPGIWRKFMHDPSFSHDLLMAARVTGSPALAARYRERAEEQARLAGAWPLIEDWGSGRRLPVRTVLGLGSRARVLLAARDDNGAWPFDADRKDEGVFKGLDYHELGADGAVELGTCARAAYEILRYARISGDLDAFRQGVGSLRLMEQFTVPRAAQVWEVPVHSPDILAAADAIDAYLEAYQFSGDDRWRGEARRWARAGMPFVYVWNDPRHPWMRYGSIPVFGASWNQRSWFGDVVQWNGLRYAYALLKLERFDPPDRNRRRRYPWGRIAKGITHSAMYQQSTGGDNTALWPDSYNTMTAHRASWDFAPRQILKNVATLIGREEEPQTVILSPGEERREGQVPPAAPGDAPRGRIHITSGAEILRAAWRDDRLTLQLRYPSQETGFTLIAGVAEPAGVALNGTPLPKHESLATAGEAGWSYHQQHASVVVRLAADGESRLLLTGIRHQWKPFVIAAAEHIDFTFDSDAEGWREDHELTPVTVKEGVLTARALGGDPWLLRHPCLIDGNRVRGITIRMRVTGGRHGQLYWITEDSPRMDEDKAIHFEVRPDGRFHEYRLEIGSHGMWRGKTITGLRLDPTSSAPGAEVGVDSIRGW